MGQISFRYSLNDVTAWLREKFRAARAALRYITIETFMREMPHICLSRSPHQNTREQITRSVSYVTDVKLMLNQPLPKQNHAALLIIYFTLASRIFEGPLIYINNV